MQAAGPRRPGKKTTPTRERPPARPLAAGDLMSPWKPHTRAQHPLRCNGNLTRALNTPSPRPRAAGDLRAPWKPHPRTHPTLRRNGNLTRPLNTPSVAMETSHARSTPPPLQWKPRPPCAEGPARAHVSRAEGQVVRRG